MFYLGYMGFVTGGGRGEVVGRLACQFKATRVARVSLRCKGSAFLH